MTATTALTAQNTLGVSGIHHVPSDFVVQQIEACIDDIGVDVIKIGMLASASTVDAVAEALKKHGETITVVDPVMVATSGAQLLPNDAVHNLRTNLLPLTTILTPNIPEARLLLQNAGIQTPDVTSLDDIVDIARTVQSLGPRYVLVKGGHLPLAEDGHVSKDEADRHTIVDVLYDGHEAMIYETAYVPSKNTHGTGCSLACKLLLPISCISSTKSFLLAPPPKIKSNQIIPRSSSQRSIYTLILILILIFNRNNTGAIKYPPSPSPPFPSPYINLLFYHYISVRSFAEYTHEYIYI